MIITQNVSQRIPEALRAERRWIVHRNKRPVDPFTGRALTGWQKPAAWMALDEALAHVEAGRADGVGFVFADNDTPFVGIDLDGCVADGKLSLAAQWILEHFPDGAYVEFSPSGMGLHIITRADKGALPAGKVALKFSEVRGLKGFEVFASSGYMTVTGNIWQSRLEAPVDNTTAVQELIDYYRGIQDAERAVRTPERGSVAVKSNGHSQKPLEAKIAPRDVESALKALHSTRADDYDDWIRVGTAIKAALGDTGFELWHRWSQQSPKYRDERDCMTHWRSFDTSRVGPGTLFYLAKTDNPDWVSPTVATKNREKSRRKHVVEHAFGDVMASVLSLDEVMTYFQLHEEGDAQLFAKLNAGKAVFDPIEGAWCVWNGRHWKADAAGHVTALFQPVAAQYLYAAAELTKRGEDEDVIKALHKRARALRFKNRMNNVLHLARKYLEIDPSKWDNAPYKLVVANGVVNLRTGELERGNPQDFIRYAAPVEWRGLDEPAPLWEQTIRDIFQADMELIAYFQRLMGVAVSGLSPARVFPIWQGEGGNGKSMILGVFQELLGPDLAGGVPQEVAVKYRRRSEGSHTTHLAALRGKRLAWVDEIERDDRVNVATVQMVTGGGPITARPAFAARPITFRPSHLFILSTNFRPQAESDYLALWDRIQLLPFEVRFVDDPKEGERRKDPELKDKLLEELPGILAWAVRGFMDFLARGQRLDPPDRVKLATEAYRRENDTVARFIEEACVVEEGARVRAQEIHNAYIAWCEEEGEKPIRKQDFAKKMKERFGYVRSKGSRFYVGIRLADGID